MAVIGYARVSTHGQSADAQVDALEHADAERVFVETASGATTARPELSACLEYVRPGDVLAVVRLDRLGRSLRHLIETIDTLGDGHRMGTGQPPAQPRPGRTRPPA